MQEHETVQVTSNDSIATITLNRPAALNAFNVALRRDLLVAVRGVNADAKIRVVIITGAGKGFCSGADLADRNPPDQTVEDRINDEYKPLLLGIAESSKPWIAAVNGVAAGIGGALAMACDLIVMHRDAYFFQAFSGIGLIPDGGTSWHLNRQLGPKRAYEMMAFGQKVSAVECLELGLINQLGTGDSVVDDARDYALRLLTKAPLSLRYTKEVMRETATSTLGEAISTEGRFQLKLNQSEDFAEGKQAFLDKRKPVWKGC